MISYKQIRIAVDTNSRSGKQLLIHIWDCKFDLVPCQALKDVRRFNRRETETVRSG